MGSLSEDRNTNSSLLVERPQTRNRGLGAGRKDERCNRDLLLGLSCNEFQGLTAVPWNEARLCPATAGKEIPTALMVLFQKSKLIPIK